MKKINQIQSKAHRANDQHQLGILNFLRLDKFLFWWT